MVVWFLAPVLNEKVLKALDQAFLDNGLSKRLTLLNLPAELNATEFVSGDLQPILTTHGYDADMSVCFTDRCAPACFKRDDPVRELQQRKDAAARAFERIHWRNKWEYTRCSWLGWTGTCSSLDVGWRHRTALGQLPPPNAAYQSDGNGGFFANSKWVMAPNPTTRPGGYSDAVNTGFENALDPRYSFDFWNSVVNQPAILKGVMTGQSKQNSFFFNESTAAVQFRAGNVTLGSAASGASLLEGVLQDKYEDVHGFSACAQNVSFIAQK